MAIFMVIAILFFASTNPSKADYCYADNENIYSYHGSTNGPRRWPTFFPTCDGYLQSPINIQTNRVISDLSIEKLSFTGYDTPIKRADVVNDGHTVAITPRDNVNRGITVGNQYYNLLQIHFHWGSEDLPGGEHTLNGRRFEMEAHFVHRNSNNQTAMVGVLIEEVKKDNKGFRPIVKVLPNVMYKHDTTKLKSSLYLSKLIPEMPASFYGYTGSLTTPMCTEGVAWFVLQKKQTIGWRQLHSFLKIYSVEKRDRSMDCLMAPNNRPLQNSFRRVVYASQ